MDSLITDFRPLTHIEIEQDKPLRVKIAGEMLEFDLMTTKNVILLFQNKDYIINAFNSAHDLDDENQKTLIYHSAVQTLISLILNIVVKPKFSWYKIGAVKRWEKKLRNYFYEHTGELFKLLDNVLVYQTNIFFLLKTIGERGIVQTQTYSKTDIEASSQETYTPRHTLKQLVPSNLKKKKASTKSE